MEHDKMCSFRTDYELFLLIDNGPFVQWFEFYNLISSSLFNFVFQ